MSIVGYMLQYGCDGFKLLMATIKTIQLETILHKVHIFIQTSLAVLFSVAKFVKITSFALCNVSILKLHFYADEHLPPLSTIEQRSLAILQELPFLIEFNTRVLLLRELCRYSLTDSDGYSLSGEFMSDNTIVIRRTHLYEDAFEKLSLENGKLRTYFQFTVL